MSTGCTDVRASDDRIGRLADERLAHAGASRSTAAPIPSVIGWGRPDSPDPPEILRGVEVSARSWIRRRQSLRAAAGDQPRAAWTPPGGALLRTVAQFRRAFDERHGGFGGRRVLRPSSCSFSCASTQDRRHGCRADGALDAAGDGARRHARPCRWRIPPVESIGLARTHFEKMLRTRHSWFLRA